MTSSSDNTKLSKLPTRPKVLFVSQQCPWPKNSGGNIRTYYLAKHLSSIADVTMVTITPETDPKAARTALGLFCAEVRFIAKPRTTKLSPLKTLIKSLVFKRPAFIEHNLNAQLGSEIKDLLESNSFDWAHVNHVDTYHYFQSVDSLPLVLDTHNIQWLYYSRRAEQSENAIMSQLYKRDARLLHRYELSAFSRCQKVFVCSSNERETVEKHDQSLPVIVIPNGVDCEEHQPDENHEPFDNGPELLFVGDMAYAPNVDGVMEFIREVLPSIKKRFDKVHFTVVGKSPPVELVNLSNKRSDLTVTGFVDEIKPYFERAAIFVVPLRYGGGTRLKVPQAFAAGLPTVATTIGAEGIEYTDWEDIVIADTCPKMADAICSLLENRSLYTKIRKNSRTTALEKYDWKVIGRSLIEQCQSIR